jgi:hypothetical protein
MPQVRVSTVATARVSTVANLLRREWLLKQEAHSSTNPLELPTACNLNKLACNLNKVCNLNKAWLALASQFHHTSHPPDKRIRIQEPEEDSTGIITTTKAIISRNTADEGRRKRNPDFVGHSKNFLPVQLSLSLPKKPKNTTNNPGARKKNVTPKIEAPSVNQTIQT